MLRLRVNPYKNIFILLLYICGNLFYTFHIRKTKRIFKGLIMLTIKERLARLKIKKWVCAYKGAHGGLSVARFDTQKQALAFSETVSGEVIFDPSGVL